MLAPWKEGHDKPSCAALVAQSCPALCDCLHCSRPGCSVSGQEYWSGLSCPPPGDLPNPGIEPRSPALWADSLTSELPGKPKNIGVGSLSLLQGIFPTQELNRVSCTAGGFFTSWATKEALTNLDSILKIRDITLPIKVHIVKAMVFPVVMHACESWTKKKAEGQEQITPVTKSSGRDKTNAHKPHNAEGGRGERKQVHTSPATKRPAWGAETRAQKAPRRRGWTSGTESHMHTALRHRGWALGAEGSPHKSPRHRRIHTSTYIASFSQQHRARQGNRSTSNDPRDK